MSSLRLWLCGLALLGGWVQAGAQGTTGADAPTIRVTSRLVFLDVTVLDKKGRPVVKGLTKDDFTITEDKRPQRIFSFETPAEHVPAADGEEDGSKNKAPVTIFVMDLLNSNFEDFAYIRYSVKRYLASEPETMNSPAELMVLGNRTLEMVQGFTRSKSEMLLALKRVPVALPYKLMMGSFGVERFAESIEALQQIALQSRGISGKKNIIWLGRGSPGVSTEGMTAYATEVLNLYVHDTTNLLVDARMSLFVIYPGLGGSGPSTLAATTGIGDEDPFAGEVNFGVFVKATGGTLFHNANDVDQEMKRSQELGSNYYTLTYQPAEGIANGKFRHVVVAMRDPSLHVVTKGGYFAPDSNALADPKRTAALNLYEATRSPVPFSAVKLSVVNIVRHPDTSTAQFTLVINSTTMDWQPATEGKSTTDISVATVSLSGRRDILASRMQSMQMTTAYQDAAAIAKTTSAISITIHVPRKTELVRVIVEDGESGRMGSIEIDRKTLASAPEAPTPEPKLLARPGQMDSPAGEAPSR